MTPSAERLAKAFVAKQGYVEGTVDEALPLAKACDFILTKSDGMTFSIVCLVAAENGEPRRFDVGRDAAKDILAMCCERYAGTLNGAKLPASS